MRLRILALFLVITAVGSGVGEALAQLPADRGVVWQAPANAERARSDLSMMRDMGVTAVRTGLIEDERILRLAEAFGVSLYQEVGSAYLSTRQFRDSLDATRARLQRVASLAHRYPAARQFGIARYADTSVEATCEMMADLASAVRSAAPAGTRVYYVSLFIEEDRCADEVDFVLLNARDVERPSVLVRRWAARHDTPVGLAGIGTWQDPGSPPGLRSSRSLESQARFLEHALNDVLDSAVNLSTLFVYRWRDTDAPLPAFLRADRDPYRATYGLTNDDGQARPAAAVLAGFYRGDQQAFAFERGDATYRDWPWPVLMLWVVILMLALLYALSPRFRNTVPRYFVAHGFYRDSVREGRNLLLVSSLTMLVALALSSGIALGVTIDALGQETAFRILVSWLPDSLVRLLATASSQPLEFILIVAAVYAGIEIFWILMLTALSRMRGGLGPGQVMLIAVWPRWPLLVLTIAILAATHALSGELLTMVLLGATAVWLLVTLWSIIRAIVDYSLVSRVPGVIAVLTIILHPFIAAVLVGTLVALWNQERLEFVARVAGLL